MTVKFKDPNKNKIGKPSDNKNAKKEKEPNKYSLPEDYFTRLEGDKKVDVATFELENQKIMEALAHLSNTKANDSVFKDLMEIIAQINLDKADKKLLDDNSEVINAALERINMLEMKLEIIVSAIELETVSRFNKPNVIKKMDELQNLKTE